MSEKFKKESINKNNFRIEINAEIIKDINYNSVYMKFDDTKLETDIYFDVPKHAKIKSGDTLKVFYDDNLELEGQVIKVDKLKEDKSKKYVIGTSMKNAIDENKTYKWAFEHVYQGGGGVFIFFATVLNRQAGIGFILFNHGFYLFRKELINVKGEQDEKKQ